MNEPYKVEVRPYVHGLEMIHVVIPGLGVPIIHCVRTEDVDKIKAMIEHANLGAVFSSDPEVPIPEVPQGIMTSQRYFRDVLGWNEQNVAERILTPDADPGTPPEVYGEPRLKPVIDYICDLEAIRQAGSSMFTPGVLSRIGQDPGNATTTPKEEWIGPPSVIWDERPGGEHIVFKPLFPVPTQTKTDYAEKVKEAKERIDARKKSGQCGTTGHRPGEPSSTCVLPSGHVGPHSWESLS